MKHYTKDEVKAYAASRNLVRDALLWASDMPLVEDAFRMGGKNSPNTDFLRFADLKANALQSGRVPPEEVANWVVQPRFGISLFIKQMLDEGLKYVGSQGSTLVKVDLKKQFDPFMEKHWWKIEKGQTLPAGLQLVYDGIPPGHCILTVERSMTVQAFLSLVKLVNFESVGTAYYGKPK